MGVLDEWVFVYCCFVFMIIILVLFFLVYFYLRDEYLYLMIEYNGYVIIFVFNM